jgi:tetratricopeptide (TPR) repeat protein
MSSGFQNAESGTDELVGIIEQYLAERRVGRAPSREELLHRHADVAEDLARCLDGLELIDREIGGDGPGSVEREGSRLVGGMLGDYRILREVGRGGMGVVYEAEQVSLGRRVALKVLPFAAVFDDRHLQRFKNEAEAAAFLHHTHIVPVHAVGCERGVHYYAMQYIDGRSLAQVVTELRESAGDSKPVQVLTGGHSTESSEYCRAVAGLGIQAAEALEHAHECGVVHRDIKPANLLVDAKGHLWVTDFGLASFERNTGLTMTGDLLGTMRYMSPEQALGKRIPVDHRTDIYSLGVTLYELLTLHPAFPGDNAHDVIQAIGFQEPVGPRRRNPAIPAELETILLKAMAKEPGERYATARELADDLRRYLAHRPIAARRPTLIDRGFKWARRHRPFVLAGIALLLVGVVALAGGMLVLARERGRTNREFVRAERNFRIAQDALEQMARVAEEQLEGTPGSEDARRELLRSAAGFYRQFAEVESNDPLVLREAGKAYTRLGRVLAALDDYDAAIRAHERAISMLGTEGASFELTRARLELAITYSEAGRGLEKSRELVGLALESAESLASRRPGDLECRTLLAACCLAAGTIRPEPGLWERARELAESVLMEAPDDETAKRGLAAALQNLTIHYRDWDLQKAREVGKRAIEIFEERLSDAPRSERRRYDLARAYDCLGLVFAWDHDSEEAELCFRRVQSLTEALVADYPWCINYRMVLWRALGHRSDCVPLEKRARLHQRRLELTEKMIADFPEAQEHRRLEESLRSLGRCRFEQGRLEEAVELLRRAAAVPREMGEEPRESTIKSLADCLWYAGDEDEARALFRETLRLLEDRLASRRDGQEAYAALARFLATCPDTSLRDPVRAASLARRSVELAPDLKGNRITLGVASYRHGDWEGAVDKLDRSVTGEARLYRAMALERLGRSRQARECYESARAWVEEHAPAHPKLRALQAESEQLLGIEKD